MDLMDCLTIDFQTMKNIDTFYLLLIIFRSINGAFLSRLKLARQWKMIFQLFNPLQNENLLKKKVIEEKHLKILFFQTFLILKIDVFVLDLVIKSRAF